MGGVALLRTPGGTRQPGGRGLYPQPSVVLTANTSDAARREGHPASFPETYHSGPEEDIRQIPTEGHSVKSGQSSSKPSKVIKTQGCLRNSQPRGAEEASRPNVWYTLGRGGGLSWDRKGT